MRLTSASLGLPPSSLQGYQSALSRCRDGFRAIGHFELVKDGADVIFDCALVDGQLLGDLTIAQALRDQLQHFHLTRR